MTEGRSDHSRQQSEVREQRKLVHSSKCRACRASVRWVQGQTLCHWPTGKDQHRSQLCWTPTPVAEVQSDLPENKILLCGRKNNRPPASVRGSRGNPKGPDCRSRGDWYRARSAKDSCPDCE